MASGMRLCRACGWGRRCTGGPARVWLPAGRGERHGDLPGLVQARAEGGPWSSAVVPVGSGPGAGPRARVGAGGARREPRGFSVTSRLLPALGPSLPSPALHPPLNPRTA